MLEESQLSFSPLSLSDEPSLLLKCLPLRFHIALVLLLVSALQLELKSRLKVRTADRVGTIREGFTLREWFPDGTKRIKC